MYEYEYEYCFLISYNYCIKLPFADLYKFFVLLFDTVFNNIYILQHYVQALRSCWGTVEQVRGYYVNWRMLRDVKRRKMAFEYADERLRINALRKNTILPKELQVQTPNYCITSLYHFSPISNGNINSMYH